VNDPFDPQEPRKGLSRGVIAFLIVLAVVIIGAGICVAIVSNIQY
jgi:hypothetical protein